VFNSGTATLGAFTVEYCATQAAAPGTDAGAAMKFSGVTGPIRVVGNHQPIDPSRRVSGLPMRIARFNDCTGPIEYHDNTPPDPGT
jgi:hypothetical protein